MIHVEQMSKLLLMKSDCVVLIAVKTTHSQIKMASTVTGAHICIIDRPKDSFSEVIQRIQQRIVVLL